MKVKIVSIVLIVILVCMVVYEEKQYHILKGKYDLLNSEYIDIKNSMPVIAGSTSTTVKYIHLTDQEKKEISDKYGIEIERLNKIIDGMKEISVVSTTNAIVNRVTEKERKNLVSGGYFWKNVYAIEYQRSIFKNVFVGVGILWGNTETKFGIKAGVRF